LEPERERVVKLKNGLKRNLVSISIGEVRGFVPSFMETLKIYYKEKK